MTLFRERYEVLATVGSGGEAQIIKALDRQHGRFVALKIRPVRDQAAREDLLGEARVLLSLPPHPALPLVREDFFDRGDYVVAMDWVEGTDLATLLGDRGRPGLAPSSVLAYLAQAAEALTYLHAQSPPVIHGDVKPGNLILTKGGRIKLVDFGLSSAPNVPRVRAGTPGYRAPELAGGASPSRASDVYALAATAFALLTGSAPAGVLPGWQGFDKAQAQQLEAAIRLGMATDPARRPTTPGELVERLRAGWSTALPTGVVTFCCSDIAGSAALWESYPEAMAEALVRHDELIADAVEARGGSLIKSMGEGDSSVSVFDSAPAAVAAAVAANRALAAEEWPPGVRIAARWGINTGEAERRDADYYGPSVILAARVRAQADGGEILLSSVTSELVAAHLPERCSLVDLGPHRLNGLGKPERISALAGPGVHTPLSAGKCPYRGLLAFEPDDRALFFGREAVVAELIDRVVPGRLLAVVGASGSGKSSVLRAGLLAAARAGEIAGIDDGVVLTPGAEPDLDVADEPTRLVVIDQFEELFTLCADGGRRQQFIDALLRLRCAVAIGMRADLYGRLGGHAELARAVAKNQLLLGAMTAKELARTVTEPARCAGLRLEPGLVELILRDVASEPGALPLLSHALRATWERRDGRTLTVEGYRETGGVASALARTADAVVDALPAEQRSLARGVFVRMTELGEGSADSRRSVTVEELVPDDTSPDTVRALLRRLADARLVTLDDGAAEVAHEALIRAWPRLRRWLDEDRAGIRAHRQLSDAARVWEAGGRETSDLYRGARLAGALELAHAGRAEINATERAFLDAGAAESERERRAEQQINRRLRGLLAGALALLGLAVVGGIVSLEQRGNAQEAEAVAERQALGSDAQRVGALALSAPRLELSLLYALAGVELDDRLETRSDLLTVLQLNPGALRTLYLQTERITSLATPPGGDLVAVGDDTGTIRFLDPRTWEAVGRPVRVSGSITLQGMTFAPDGRTLAVATEQGVRLDLSLVDVAARTALPVRSWRRNPIDSAMPSVSLAYAPGGRRLAVAVPTSAEERTGPPVRQRLLLLDVETGRVVWQRRLPLRPGQWEAHTVFTPAGDLVTSSQQGETIVWDAAAGRIVRRFPVGGRLALAPDGHTLALALNSSFPGAPSSAVALLDLRTGDRRELRADLPEEWITALVFTPDGSKLVGAAFAGTHVWEVAGGGIVDTFGRRNDDSPGTGAAVARGGVAITTPGDGILSIWDVDGRQRLGRHIPWGTRRDSCSSNPCATIDPSGRLMATGKGDGRVVLVDLVQGRRVHTFPARDGRPADAYAFTPDGLLVTGGAAGTVTLWNVASRSAEATLEFHAPVRGAAYAPQGRLLAVVHHADGARNAQIEVRELTAGAPRYTVTAERGFSDLRFSPDGRLLIALDGRSRLAVWEARTGARRLPRELPGQAAAFAVMPDSRSVLVGTETGTVARWDLATGRRIGGTATVGEAAGLAVTPDGRRFAVGSYDGSTTLWDLRTLERIGEAFPEVPGVIPVIAFDPAGRLLITNLGSSVLWTLDPEHLRRVACRAAGRDISREEWANVLPGRPYRRVCA